MAILFMDGFDHYDDAEIGQKWTSSSNATISANGRNSSNSMYLDASGSNGSCFKSVSPTSTTTGGVGFAFYTTSLFSSATGGPHPIVGVWESGTNHIGLMLNTSGYLTLYRNTTTLSQTTSAALTPNTFYYIEFKWTISDSVGTAEVKFNGTTVMNATGLDTRNGGTGVWNSIGFYNGSNNTSLNVYLDDVVIWDTSGSSNNDFLGPIRVVTILPDGAGNSSDFTPSAGLNYQNVDETSTDGDTTYNSETTPGDHDTYTFGAVGVTGTVRGVQTNLMVRSDGAGAETIRPKIRIGTTDYNGTTVGISTSYTDSREVFQTSPATATAWTVTEIDGAEFGIELVS